jgi:uncharacterized membrane protein YkoI
MTPRTKGTFIAAAAVATLAAGGGALAVAAGGDESTSAPRESDDRGQDAREGPDRSITGGALAKAKATALEHTGGGRVTDTEVGDEEGYYEVEVTAADGSQSDVHLDRDFNVLGQQGDEDRTGDD